MGEQQTAPALSIVVVSFGRTLDALERCLRAVNAQRVARDAEIIVVRKWHVEAGEDAGNLASKFRHVRWLNATDGTIPHMRRLGVAESSGQVVALVEDDCVVDVDWGGSIMRAHAGPHVAVGGAVEPGAYRSALDWAVYFCDYSRFMLPFAGGEESLLPGSNVSYKRRVVPELLAITEQEGLQETFVHRAWHETGKPMFADPRIVVRNEHRWTVADVSSVPFHHGRAFGGRRAHTWGLEQKMLFALSTAALPLVQVARILLRVARRRRAIVPLVRALPWIGLFNVSWAAGECVGYAMGAGDSLRRWR